jgi:hypothetical protein
MKKFAVLLLPLLVSGCLLESVGPIDRSIKPYGAHWVKEGMTKESRRDDLASCGSINHEEVKFPTIELERARLPGDPNEINAYLRLRNQLGQCMKARGYWPVGDLKYLGGCDASCLYP